VDGQTTDTPQATYVLNLYYLHLSFAWIKLAQIIKIPRYQHIALGTEHLRKLHGLALL
jgi:hypothetical protein